MNVQHLFISGRATKAPEVKESKNGNKYSNFSIAVNEFNKKTEEEKTTFYDVVVFGKRAENTSEMIAKGDQVIVFGKPEIEAYINKDGEAVGVAKLICESWRVLK